MKVPGRFSQHESLLDQFVVAADTSLQLPACDLLFIHGNDLTWGGAEHGFFLAEISVDEEFEEILQVVESRSKVSFTQLLKLLLQQLEPKLLEMFKAMAPHLQNVGSDQAGGIAAGIASLDLESGLTKLDKILPDILKQWPLFADGIASWLVKGARSLYQRQLSITGMSNDRYKAMVRALDKLNICEHVVRVAYPKGGFHFELSLTGRGEFKTTVASENARFLELLRVRQGLAALKRGQDNGLAVFIADYLNRHFVGANQAFACAYYGPRNEPELDVVVPALRLGFEVKLSQSPFTQTENKLQKLANDLRRQLPFYAERGCERIFYVSNLSKEMAETVLRKAQEGSKPLVNVDCLAAGVAGGMETLLPVLKGIGEALNALLENNWQQKAVAIMNATYEAGGQASKGAKASTTRTGSKKVRRKPRTGKVGVKRGKK
jgi:hypothetical protein